jgi:hypothetical protein
MFSLLRRRPTYSGVTSTLALVLALGGGAYAATALPANSVGSKQLKKNAVVPAKIKKNAVVAAKIKQGAVNSSKVKNGSLTGADINLSSLGTVPSATNSTNAPHAASSAAIDRAILRTAAGTTTGPTAAATANCDTGYRPVGGGARVADEQNAFLVDSYPEPGGWTARVATDPMFPSAFTVYVICVPIGSVG